MQAREGKNLKAEFIHLMQANITTEVAPIVGTEKQSEELVTSLLSDFEAEPLKIWQSNIIGKSLHELVNEGLQNKLLNMPPEARQHIQQTLERVINEVRETVGDKYNAQTVYNMSAEQIHYDIANWAIAGNRLPSLGFALWYFNPFSPTCCFRISPLTIPWKIYSWPFMLSAMAVWN